MIFTGPTPSTKDAAIAIGFQVIYIIQVCLSLVGFGGFIFTDEGKYIRENERNLFLLAIVGFVMTLGTLPLFLYILSRIWVFGIPRRTTPLIQGNISLSASRLNPWFLLVSWGLGLCLILCNIAFLSLFIERCKQNPKVGTNTYLSKEKAIIFLSCHVLFFILYIGLLVYQRKAIFTKWDTIEKQQALRQSLSKVETVTEQQAEQQSAQQAAGAPESESESKRLAEKEIVDAKIAAALRLQEWLENVKAEKQRAPQVQDLSGGDICKFHELGLTKEDLEGIVRLAPNIDEAIYMLHDIETLFLAMEDNTGCGVAAATYYNDSFRPVYNKAVETKNDPNRRIREIRLVPEEKQPEIDNKCAFEKLPARLKEDFETYKSTIMNTSCENALLNYNTYIQASMNKSCPEETEQRRKQYSTFYNKEKKPGCVEYKV